jgi:hypothetical protein
VPLEARPWPVRRASGARSATAASAGACAQAAPTTRPGRSGSVCPRGVNAMSRFGMIGPVGVSDLHTSSSLHTVPMSPFITCGSGRVKSIEFPAVPKSTQSTKSRVPYGTQSAHGALSEPASPRRCTWSRRC